MRSSTWLMSGLLALTACGNPSAGDNQATASGSPSAATSTDGGEAAPADAGAAATAGASLAGRTRELSNPDDFAMVLLYYSLSGTPAPIDKWVEADMDVRIAKPIDKEVARQAARRKIEAGLAAAKDVGTLRLTMDAGLSEFDPTYNEFTIRTLSPSSSATFRSFDEQVSVKFDNGDKAQRWSVDPKDARSINDRVQYGSSATIEMVLKITGSTPTASGGTITTNVLSYEIKSRRDGTTLVRKTV